MLKRKILLTLTLVIILIGIVFYGSLNGVTAESKTDEELYQDTLSFLEYLQTADYARAVEQFDEKVRAALPEKDFKELWNKITKDLGELISWGNFRTSEQAGYQITLLTCNFEKVNLDLQLAFNSEGKISGFHFLPTAPPEGYEYIPPDYVKKDQFLEQEISFGAPGWELPGLLSLPQREGPFPGVVLIHGSGPNDRDETIGPNKPFKDLAWGLASEGIVVLRYDKRTKVYASQIDPKNFTVQGEVIEDALLALDFLRQQEKVDPEKVFLLGHSLGGQLVPNIANQDKKVAGVIVLAGPTRPLHHLIPAQMKYIFSLDGEINPEEAKKLEEIKNGVQLIDERKLKEDEVATGLGGYAGYWYDLQERDPVSEALKLSCPLFILQGGRDYQVTLEDFQGWQQGLASQTQVTFQLYPQLNHLFIAGEGKSTPEEYQIGGHIEAEVIKDLASWILSLSR
ncbi:MAG TPA: hypothetical protein DEG96_01080 [Candidatus Atribacteria bacterium]|nr:hypothetical protein [Candidatus Atribacteria bacterium]